MFFMSKTKKIIKRIFWVLVSVMVVGLAVVAGCELAVYSASKGRVYSDVDEIPHREVGLLLGTSPKGRRGGVNMFYEYRIDAAVALYEAGKVDRFIISGAKFTSALAPPRNAICTMRPRSAAAW